MPNTDTFTIQAGEGMAIEGDGNTFTFSSSGGGSDTASYLSTPNAGGFTTDQYGNFVHGSTTTTNSWNIKSHDGTNKFQVNFESGATVIDGPLNAGDIYSNGEKLLPGVASSFSGKRYATLAGFVSDTAAATNGSQRNWAFSFLDTGGWGPLGTTNE